MKIFPNLLKRMKRMKNYSTMKHFFMNRMMLLFDNSNDDDSDSSLSSSSNSSISSAALKDGKGNPSVDFQGTNKQQMMITTAAKTASEEAQQLQRTTSGTTKRSTKISGFEVKESNKSLNEFESAEYISQESIARAIMRPCCTKECLLAEKAKHRRWIFMPKF
jgi:hypothetical protein